jgi:hypothetical protein
MARRIDGRIEPGQKISTALSARAWNRAQDAADIVLGERLGLGIGDKKPSPLHYVVVRMPLQSATNLGNNIDLAVGHSVGMPLTGTRNSIFNTNLSLPWNPNNEEQNRVTLEQDLAVPSSAFQWIDIPDAGMASEQFGVIESISKDEVNGVCFARLIVGGVFMCRAIAWAPADRLMGPPPVPAQQTALPLWRPYATMAPAGSASVLAVGAWYRLGANPWPRVYECLVRM